MKISYFYFSLPAFLFSGLTEVYAQPKNPQLDTLQVEIIKEYRPEMSGAIKISENPRIVDTLVIRPEVKYALLESYLKTTFNVEPIQPVKIKGEPLAKLYRCYLKGGVGNYTTTLAEADCHTLRSREYSAGANLKHFSSYGPRSNKGASGFSDNFIHLYGKKFIYEKTLSGDLAFDRDIVHYYGFGADDYNKMVNLNNEKDLQQRFSRFNGKINFTSPAGDSSGTGFIAGMEFNNLAAVKDTAVETNVKFVAGVEKHIGKEMMTIDLDIDHYAYSFGSAPGATNTVIEINPVISSTGKLYRFDIGLNGFTDIKTDVTTHYYFYPYAFFSYNVFKEYFIPYASVSGELVKNSWMNLTSENPFLVTTSIPENSNQGFLEFKAGIKGALSRQTTYNGGVLLSDISNMYFFVNDFSDGTGSRFTLVYDTVKILNGYGEIKHRFTEKFNGLVKAGYTQYTMEREEKSWHRPSLELTLSGWYNLRDKIILHGDIFATDGFYAKVITDTLVTSVKRKGYADINVGVEYHYNNFLSAFINFNNLTAAKYNRWYNYPVQRFQVLAGVNLSF